MDKHLNIIALNIPYPANYGGVIDIFYKLHALNCCGIKIHLHCFEYGRAHARELNSLCEEVFYYKRNTGFTANFSLLPYNVCSRKNKQLLQNLLTNNYPILFEGLHSCYLLGEPALSDRKKVFRECNIEHHYYMHLAKAERNTTKKVFFYIEALKFKAYQHTLQHADLMVAVSETDTNYLRKHFPGKHIEFIPCFHKNEQISILPGQSNYLLYHGNLSVPENERAALYLIKNVFCRLEYQCIVAGLNPTVQLLREVSKYKNIRVEISPSENRMEQLVREAQVHVLVTFQDTGLKLKLLNTLYTGRYVVANQMMLAGSGLDSLCRIAESPEDLLAACKEYMKTPFKETSVYERAALLIPNFSNLYQAQRLSDMLYV